MGAVIKSERAERLRESLRHWQDKQHEATAKVEQLRKQCLSADRAPGENAKPVVTVTDHALLRYAERVLDLDVRGVNRSICEQIAEWVLTLGDGRYPLKGGFVAIVRGNCVVTVVEAD